MRKRKLHEAIRTSLENFGQFDHYDPEDDFEQRHVDIVPLYALSNLVARLLSILFPDSFRDGISEFFTAEIAEVIISQIL